jgi:hypothetical protein|tara:strand:+ start:312 stop:941 length:630 start_codon:yes stop_codon:yes gene_type:complete
MTDKTFKDYLKKETVQENYLKYFLGNPAMYKMFSDVDKGMTEEEFNKKYPRRKGEYAKIKKEIADMNESKQMNEDSVDMEKHNTLNDIFQALERLNTEVDELDALDSDMDSTGVGDLNDQLTTFRKHISALYQVLDRAGRIVPMESVNEAVDQALIDQVVDQIIRDIEMGDQTAIEELLMSCPEDKLRGFLSEVGESKDLEHLKKLAGI